jgi:F-type H+-transporting ATPase subunit gamma
VAAKTLVVPITSDKGLCGGINSTVVKYTKVINGVCTDSESEASLYVFGEKGRAQLARGATQKQLVGVLVDVAKPKEGITFASASLVADSLLGTGYEKMHLIYNRFQSVISFKPTVATLLSSSALEASGEAAGGLPFDQYEAEGPDRSEFLLDLSEFHLAATLYNALLENSTSELGSRMQSMENSTKNAQEMLSKLTLFYNRTRQAAITTELIEIVSLHPHHCCACCRADLRPFSFLLRRSRGANRARVSMRAACVLHARRTFAFAAAARACALPSCRAADAFSLAKRVLTLSRLRSPQSRCAGGLSALIAPLLTDEFAAAARCALLGCGVEGISLRLLKREARKTHPAVPPPSAITRSAATANKAAPASAAAALSSSHLLLTPPPPESP